MAKTVAIKWYGLGMLSLAQALVDWEDDTIKIALSTSTHTPAQDTHNFFNDVTNEVVATGYTAGGATLGTKTAGYTDGTNVLKLSGATVSWTITGSMTARNVHIYKSTGAGTPETSPLIGYGVFEVDATPADVTVTDGAFEIAWSADGILKMTAGT